MVKKKTFKGSKKYEIKHMENPTGKLLLNTTNKAIRNKDYSRNQRNR